MARWQENMTGQILKASENKSVLREEQSWYLKLMMNMVEITRGDLNLL
jgi:hypothetical protein